MKAWPIVAASALAAGLLPVAASATPVDESFSSSNVYGITGYILTPNAAVVPSGCVDLGAHYVQGSRFHPLQDAPQRLFAGRVALGVPIDD